VEHNKQIKGIITSIFNAFKEGDTNQIEKHLHEKASVWDVFTPDLICGKEELEAFHEHDQAQKDSRGDLSIKLDEPIIRVIKDFAIATYCLEFDYKEPNALNGKVRVTDLFILEAEKWKILHHHEGIAPIKDT
jgi:ketosteroid isomerase-like protein